jgi:hypothetical protein
MAVPDIRATANPQYDRGEVASQGSSEYEGESEDEDASDVDEVQEKVCSKDGVLLALQVQAARGDSQRANSTQASSRSHDVTCVSARYTDRSSRLQRRCQ